MTSRIVATGLTEEGKIRRILEEEGFFNVFRWCDDTGTRYGEHTHPHHEIRWILSGVLRIIENGTVHTLHPGDRLESPPETPHSAYVPENCCYLCGSR